MESAVPYSSVCLLLLPVRWLEAGGVGCAVPGCGMKTLKARLKGSGRTPPLPD